MATPSQKTEGMEQGLIAMWGYDRREYIARDQCVPSPGGCGGDASEFKDELSREEYTISGMCQKCQDDFYRKFWHVSEVSR